MEQEEKRLKRPYKIMIGDVVTVYRNDYNGKTFYRVSASRKSYDDTKEWGYKTIKFKSGVDIPDETKIRILDMFEDFYNKDRYTTIWTLFITEFEIIDESESMRQYNETLANNNEGYDNFEITSDDLPF